MPCLYISPERESSSKGPKRVLGFRAGASMARFRSCGSVSPIFCPKEYVPKQCGSYLFARQSGGQGSPHFTLTAYDNLDSFRFSGDSAEPGFARMTSGAN